MPSLVTRFHLLIIAMTLATGAVAFLHVPADYAFAAHWQRNAADWLWPRNLALAIAPLFQLLLVGAFMLLGRALTKNHFAKTRHILDPLLTLYLAVALACQMSLLFMAIGTDLDLFRGTAFALAAVLVPVGIVLFGAERHTYAGLRLPWPIKSDRAWRLSHRGAGLSTLLAAAILLWCAWLDPGPGMLVIAMTSILVALPVLAVVSTALSARL